MIATKPLPALTEHPDYQALALHRLRQSIADEYINKLPQHLSLIEFARLVRASQNEVLTLISRGMIVARVGGPKPRIYPVDNASYLMRPAILALVTRGSQFAPATEPTVIEVSAHAFERLSQRASDAGLDHATVVDRILAFADTALLSDDSGARTAGYLLR